MAGFWIELATYAKTNKRFWLTPFVVTGVTFLVLLWLVDGAAIAPFAYSLF